MKRIFTLVLVFTFVLAAVADAATRLTISANTRYNIRVVIDGVMYNEKNNSGDGDIVLTNLRPGYHNVKVYQQGRYNGQRNRQNSYGQLLYEGNVYVKQQYHVDITINRFGKAFIDERSITGNYDSDDNDWNDNGGWNNNGSWNNRQAMNARSFEQFRVSLARESFDNTRLALAKQTIASNLFTSEQMKVIVNLFAFDQSKLEVAKYGYDYTIDKQNYFLLNDAFAYSNSREELARYIQQRR